MKLKKIMAIVKSRMDFGTFSITYANVSAVLCCAFYLHTEAGRASDSEYGTTKPLAR